MKAYLPLLCAVFLLSGCTSESDQANEIAVGPNGLTAPADDSAQASVRFALDALESGQPVVVWNALPAKHQNDVNDVVRSFAGTMDPDVWNQVVDLVRGLQEVLEEKPDFFANHPMIAGSSSGAAKETIPKLATMLKTIVDGVGDLESLQTFDGQKFVGSTATSVLTQMEDIGQMFTQSPAAANPFASLTNVEIETIDSTEKSAELRFTFPDGHVENQNFMKMDGKWIPMDLVQNWDENIKNAKDQIKKLPETMKSAKVKVIAVSGMVNGMISGLKNAETQEQFDGVLNSIVGQAMMMSGMMGGAAPPQGGAPPAEQPGSLGDVPADSPN